MVTIDGSIVLIAMPDIFRGIGLDPLLPGNSFYLLWMILGFLVVTSVLVVSLGRLGDMYGRVKIYNLGFALFTFFSLLLTITWMSRNGRGASGSSSCGSSKAWAGPCCSPTRRRSSPTPFRPTSGAWRSGSTGWPATSGTFIGLVLGGLLGPDQLAADLPGVGAHRAVLHGVGLHGCSTT